MAAFAPRRVNAAGDCEDLAAVFVGEVGGDERAAGQVGLDDNRAERHAGDDAVADGEGLLVGGAIEGKLGNQRAVGGDLLEQLRILGRRDQVDACS